MLDQWEREHPGRSETMFRALCHVAPSQLADPKLFDFAVLGAQPDAARNDAHAWLEDRDSRHETGRH
jgi:tRNA 2-thiocytidine biosynthesis protein TtcA